MNLCFRDNQFWKLVGDTRTSVKASRIYQNLTVFQMRLCFEENGARRSIEYVCRGDRGW